VRTATGFWGSAGDDVRERLGALPARPRLDGLLRGTLRLGAAIFLEAAFFLGLSFFAFFEPAFFVRDLFFLAMAKVYHPQMSGTTESGELGKLVPRFFHRDPAEFETNNVAVTELISGCGVSAQQCVSRYSV
jgi:hypothetical protein